MSTAFAMLASGSQGRTKQGLHQALHVQSLRDVDEVYNKLLTSLESAASSNDSFDLKIANKIYTQTGSVVLDSYQSTLKTNYHADIEGVDFADNMGAVAAGRINSWVSEQTNDLIKQIVAPPLDPATKMVLINAIYFQGKWVKPFYEFKTRKAKFHGIDETEVDFMSQDLYVHVFEPEGKNFVLLDLPYKGNASMVILLPNQDANLDDIVSMTDNDQYEIQVEALLQTSKRTVTLFLPKFKLESEFDLKPVLSSLGAGDVFAPGVADLSGINGQRDLYVSKAIHKAVVDVDEEGTKAAGVTAIHVVNKSASFPRPKVYKVDRPFLFFIRDHGTGINLFTGIVRQL
ncbi:Serpin B9 [Halotydeus destructor]|nr:Serpin B9 [Halotydeus destructor]